MSAGSPRRSQSQNRAAAGSVVVSPQHVTDPSILDSVAGFINEVATYNVPVDTKDQIQWALFEHLDSDAVLEDHSGDKVIPSALILVLGYTTGVQVWAIPANGEAVELLAWRHGAVRVLRLLPTPHIAGHVSQTDFFASKRPLMALCDTTTPGPNHCALSFLSLKTGEQVKVIKFKNPLLDVLANRRSVVVTFSERIAIFDAFTLEDRLTVTTCYLSPGLHPNPIALGSRWMAYAEKKLISNRRSSGGNEGEGVQSYTATVLHAAKSLGKGLRELGETVASSLTGNPSLKPGSPGNNQIIGNMIDTMQKGVVTVLDIENQVMDDKTLQAEGVVAHFAAHSEAIVCMAFDPSGLLLLTADKRGHDFHVFRIHPHPGGPALAAVHHLYVLHRGDTTARVQDMCFSPDSRWVAVSTLRGTTHVFPITPYGGNVGVRTHATPHVVNRMSRFHRSAGLPVEGRSNSPVSLFEAPVNSNLPYNNPRLPPYSHPTVIHPLAQIRQPLYVQAVSNLQQRPHAGRPRLNSSSEDNIQIALRLCCCFASPRAWFDSATQHHDTAISKQQAKPVESLFIMSCHGTLLQYDLDPHHQASVPKEKICDETPIELSVQAKAQWMLQRQPNDVPLPVSPQNLNLLPQFSFIRRSIKPNHADNRWLSQVEIVTHAGPHRRLWMGPQFTFKTYNTNGSASLNDAQIVDVNRSKPVNMPASTAFPILIESGSVSSCEQSPKLLDTYQRFSEEMGGVGELQLKEDLADAMIESPGVRESGGRCVIVSVMKSHSTGVAKVVNPLGTVVTIHSDDDHEAADVEDTVIHENCDEALFRPVVAPKSVLFAERVKPDKRVEVSDKGKNNKNGKGVISMAAVAAKNKVKNIENSKNEYAVVNNHYAPIEVKIESKLRAEPKACLARTNKDTNVQSKEVRVTKVQEEVRIKVPEEVKPKVQMRVEKKRFDSGEYTTEVKVQPTSLPPKLEVRQVEANGKKIKIKENKVDRDVFVEASQILEEVKAEVKKSRKIKNNEIDEIKEVSEERHGKDLKRRVKEDSKNDVKELKDNKKEGKEEKYFAKMAEQKERKEDKKPVKKEDKCESKTERKDRRELKEEDKEVKEETIEERKKINNFIEDKKAVQEVEHSYEELKLDLKFESKSRKRDELKVNGNSKNESVSSSPEPPFMSTLITTPDLMDDDSFDFTFKKVTKDDFDFFKTDDLLKEEKFEDAISGEILDFAMLKVEKEAKLEDDEKSKKPRKPKPKLGVRLSKGNADRSDDIVEVTLPLKSTWSSIVGSKAVDEKPILDFEIAPPLTFEPKKSYSTVAKQNLFEIDPLEDISEAVLQPEKTYKENLLKIEKSDDEKQESSQETTESDDSAKVIAMDTEEDGCQVTKGSQGTEKVVKRKSKKKKR